MFRNVLRPRSGTLVGDLSAGVFLDRLAEVFFQSSLVVQNDDQTSCIIKVPEISVFASFSVLVWLAPVQATFLAAVADACAREFYEVGI